MATSNVKAMDQIHLLLEGLREDNIEDVLSEITQVVRDSGREIATERSMWCIANTNDTFIFYGEDGQWHNTEEEGWLVTQDRDRHTLPRYGFWLRDQDRAEMTERRASNLRSAAQTLDTHINNNFAHSWRWLDVDERETNDHVIEVTWASAPSFPDSLSIQYTMTELQTLRQETQRVRAHRPTRDRLRSTWGVTVGDRLANREAIRAVVIPANRNEGVWEIGQYRPEFQYPCFYDGEDPDNAVLYGSFEGTEVRMWRDGYVRLVNPADPGQVLTSGQEIRDRFPTGRITWEQYDSGYFVVDIRRDPDDDWDRDEAGESYEIGNALSRMASILRVRPFDYEATVAIGDAINAINDMEEA